MLLGVIKQCGPPSSTFQKRRSSPLQFGQEDNIPGHSMERRAYWFILKIARMFSIPTNRNRMMNTFIIVNITLHVWNSLKDKSMLFHSKKARIYLGTFLKEDLTNLFSNLPGYFYSHTSRVHRNTNTVLMVDVNPTYKRLNI